MKTKTMSFMTILGIFVLTTFLLSQQSMDIQTSFAAKNYPGCLLTNEKAIAASSGNCIHCDRAEVTSGACPDPIPGQ